MALDWDLIVQRLKAYPAGTHSLLPPCAQDRLLAVEETLGRMPDEIGQMLKRFNCAHLFIYSPAGGPMISIFGISSIPPLPAQQWAPHWYIDAFTPTWRRTHGKPTDWAIAMTNYGGLVILEDGNLIRQWDRSVNAWDALASGPWAVGDWIEELFREGDAYLAAD